MQRHHFDALSATFFGYAGGVIAALYFPKFIIGLIALLIAIPLTVLIATEPDPPPPDYPDDPQGPERYR